ncbi:unnamed protein product [Rodentolepis nana]|uniref:Protein kinase domain-containing protein n=1 Tax=Rodentolepis nana TaxID=102285 RepID=A0A0R3TWY5_RODNA|nr:unnamed protein product [Rodentolepis nana]
MTQTSTYSTCLQRRTDSLGVILYILVCGSFPFPGESLGDIRCQVLRGLVRFPFFLSSACEQVIRGMLQVEPSKRLRLEQVIATPWMQSSPNLIHYTKLLDQYTSKARQQQADALLQRQFPEHSSVITTTRCQRRMESLDGGLVRALALATGANEEEIRKATAHKSFDRLHAGYALLSDKIARFAANAKLREVVESWIKNSGAPVTNVSGSFSSETKKMSIFQSTGGGDDGRSSASKLMSWREEVEEDDDEPGFEAQPKLKAEEDEDVSITASAVQNLSVSQCADDKNTGLASYSLPQSDLVSSWVNDFRANRTDVRIALSILQADESQLIEEISDMEPDSTTKNLRRHTIQFPSPVMQNNPLEETHPSLSGEHHQDIRVYGQIQEQQGHGYIHSQQEHDLSGEGKSHMEVGKEESGGRGPLSGRIPRQITQPELGSWKMGGLQREAPGTVVGEMSSDKSIHGDNVDRDEQSNDQSSNLEASENGISIAKADGSSSRYSTLSIPPSPPKQVTIDQLAEATKNFYSMSLVHEISVDSNFKVSKNEEPEEAISKMYDECHQGTFMKNANSANPFGINYASGCFAQYLPMGIQLATSEFTV